MNRRRPRKLGGGDAKESEPLWYKDAIFYELRVRSFQDSNGDGIGDFGGLTEKLDYLQDLGVTVLWLLPFYPSPGRDDGYDISDYTGVHADVGTLADFQELLGEAHRRSLRVVTELVLNHTSDQHPWFQRARRAAAGSPERDFYVWNADAQRYREARIIFKDFEPSNWSWDPIAQAYYWHRFFAHQPDLNFDNPAVHEALFSVVDFWLGLGVDGLRLDAVPYLYEREGTSCENLAETHLFLRKLRRHVDAKFPDRMLLAEANQWPEDAAAYFGAGAEVGKAGDECHMNFHFPIMPRLFMAIHMEDRLPIIDILAQTPPLDESCQWAMFLRNHDELTLEMVTDEERDYMYRAYASDQAMRINLGIRRRLAPLTGNDRRKIELMNALLFSLPGTPVLYYGDEIGMGDNVYLGDRNGVRTPMQWSADRNAGFSRANPQRLILPVIIDPEYHYESLNVEAQQQNPNSLLWWTKRMLALRKRFRAFGRGTLEMVLPENPRVLTFIRKQDDETLLVVANLSRFVQYVELDLGVYKGQVPVELLGDTRFPPIGEAPYMLTLGGHAFYWFMLERPAGFESGEREAAYQPPTLDLGGPWATILERGARELLEDLLTVFLEGRRWFRPGDRHVAAAHVIEQLRVSENFHLIFLRLEYSQGAEETYVLPLAYARSADEVRTRSPRSVLAYLQIDDAAPEHGVLYDPLGDVASCGPLLELLASTGHRRGVAGELEAATLEPIDLEGQKGLLEPRGLRPEHPNALIVLGNRYLLKFFRRLDEGIRPELEIGRFLAARDAAAPTPALLGHLEYRPRHGEPITLATLHRFVAAESDGRAYTREELVRYFERVLAGQHETEPPPVPKEPLTHLAEREPPPLVRELVGAYLDAARLLGRRTAELHLLLASDPDDPAFMPEVYSTLDQRSAYQAMRNTTGSVLRLLRSSLGKLPPASAAEARTLLAASDAIYKRLEAILSNRLTGQRTRRHGDYTLGSVLYTGKDFVIVDFDGRRDRPLSERRRKRSPVRDLAGMIRSLQGSALAALADPSVVREADRAIAQPWARLWQAWTSAAFLRGYLEAAPSASFLPRDRGELAVLIDAFVLDKTLRELGSELAENPELAPVSLTCLLQSLGIEPE